MKSMQEIRRIVRSELLLKKVEVWMHISQQEIETQKLGEAFIEYKKKELATKIAEWLIINNIAKEAFMETQSIELKYQAIIITEKDFDLLLSNIVAKLM